MSHYKGHSTERSQGGGGYNKDNIGYEACNFLDYEGKYYGYVEPGASIHVEKMCEENRSENKKSEYLDDVLVVWISKKPQGGQYIVGWYEHARVYRNPQVIPNDAMQVRNLKDLNQYNIFSEFAYLIDAEKRNFKVEGPGQSNTWYGNPEVNEKVIAYIQNLKSTYQEHIDSIKEGLSDFVGSEKEAIVKVRINQDKYREGLIQKYKGQCCLCGVNYSSMLVASHIKSWSKSDAFEKLELDNGLLLCPNHDKLFDTGFISFNNDVEILISEYLDERML